MNDIGMDTIIGRVEKMSQHVNNRPRRSLDEVMKDIQQRTGTGPRKCPSTSFEYTDEQPPYWVANDRLMSTINCMTQYIDRVGVMSLNHFGANGINRSVREFFNACYHAKIFNSKYFEQYRKLSQSDRDIHLTQLIPKFIDDIQNIHYFLINFGLYLPANQRSLENKIAQHFIQCLHDAKIVSITF
jgi:hypothetical protein